MSDHAFNLIKPYINGCESKTGTQLWVTDENISHSHITAVRPADNLYVISNRFDTYQALKQRGFNIRLNDFDMSSIPVQHFDCIYYRVSKEKAVVHHIINCAAEYLNVNGCLLVSGYKNEGIKTYIDKATRYLGECSKRERGKNSSQLAVINCQNGVREGDRLDDKHYSQTRIINSKDDIEFVSKPGLFGWNKIDQGSAFLVEHLPQFMQRQAPHMEKPICIADLGCGYGYLSVMAHRLLATKIIATDNNAAAVNVCKQNFKRHGIDGEVVLTDCVEGIDHQVVDVVLCNPPFHQGFAVDSNLVSKFLIGCHRLLALGGSALFVVNSFIPLERRAADLFTHVEVLNNNRHFKLVVLIK